MIPEKSIKFWEDFARAASPKAPTVERLVAHMKRINAARAAKEPKP